jgi:hypothetical protein
VVVAPQIKVERLPAMFVNPLGDKVTVYGQVLAVMKVIRRIQLWLNRNQPMKMKAAADVPDAAYDGEEGTLVGVAVRWSLLALACASGAVAVTPLQALALCALL